jgi:Uncharacterized conserved protein (DUF2190)
MTIQQFDNGELLADVRAKLNANDLELNQRVASLEGDLDSLTWSAIKPVGGVVEADLATAVQTKLNTVYTLPGANTDITSLGGLTGGVQEADFVRFDLTPETVPTTPGTVYWDSAENAQTLSVVMAGTQGTTLQVGQEQYYRVRAAVGITNGQVVMFTGTQGNSGLLVGMPAAGVPITRPDLVLGIATENITANNTGYVTAFGLVRAINTTGSAQGEDWNDGDTLYYNPATVGALTKVRPTAPNPIVVVGIVVHSHTNGSIFVKVHAGSTFGSSDGNVQITAPENNDFVAYDAAQQRWENFSATAVKSAIGLGSVDNTSDANKPISTAQLTAINAKYTKPGSGIPATDLAVQVQTSLGKADTAYQKPALGVPTTDLTTGVQTSLTKADNSLQRSALYTIGATPVVVNIGTRGQLPLYIDVSPDPGVILRVESSTNGTDYTFVGDYNVQANLRFVLKPGDLAITHFKFSRNFGTTISSSVYVGL